MHHSIYNYDGKTLWAGIRLENDTLITGYRITNGWARENYTYFAATFSKPIADCGCHDRHKTLYKGFWHKFNMEENFPDIAGRKLVSWFEFDPAKGEELEIRVAISAVSTKGALRNLRAETMGKTFDDIRSDALEKQNKELSYSRQGFLNYRKLFDPSLGFVRPRMKDGSWREPFDLLDTHGQGFIEGNTRSGKSEPYVREFHRRALRK